MFVSSRPFLPSLILRVRSEPTLVKHISGRLLAFHRQRISMDKHSSLFRTFVNYGKKVSITLEPGESASVLTGTIEKILILESNP